MVFFSLLDQNILHNFGLYFDYHAQIDDCYKPIKENLIDYLTIWDRLLTSRRRLAAITDGGGGVGGKLSGKITAAGLGSTIW
jgi:hypothetical protein